MNIKGTRRGIFLWLEHLYYIFSGSEKLTSEWWVEMCDMGNFLGLDILQSILSFFVKLNIVLIWKSKCTYWKINQIVSESVENRVYEIILTVLCSKLFCENFWVSSRALLILISSHSHTCDVEGKENQDHKSSCVFVHMQMRFQFMVNALKNILKNP